jgi:hypothetical protein
MSNLLIALRVLVFSLLVALTSGVRAEDPAPVADEWQTVISAQISAFRAHDAAGALSYAAAPFHQTFTDPEAFYTMIMMGGYAPIATSRSHSFGKFNLLPDGQVLQEVFIVDEDQSLYGAIYSLGREEAGWRVQGVQMVKQEGMGV